MKDCKIKMSPCYKSSTATTGILKHHLKTHRQQSNEIFIVFKIYWHLINAKIDIRQCGCRILPRMISWHIPLST